jgi:hypothetical protein
LTVAHGAEKVGDVNSGRSRRPIDDRDKFGAERLHPMVTNWRCRPLGDIECPGFVATKPSLTWAPGGAKTPSRRHNCLHTLVGSATIDGDALLGMRPQSNSSAGEVVARFFGIPTFEERFPVPGIPADSLHRLP